MKASPLKALSLRGGIVHMLQVVAAIVLLSMIPGPGLPQEQEQEQEQEQAENTPRETTPAAPARRPKMPSVITFESSIGEVQFPHKVHMRMGCKKCHHQIQAKALATPHEDYLDYSQSNCEVCHKEQENDTAYYGCANCHHSNLENIADETLSSKVVVHKSCWKCHLSGTGVEASERCSFCHAREENNPDAAGDTARAGNHTDTAAGAAEAAAE